MKKTCGIVSLLLASASGAPQDLRSEPILNGDCEDLALGLGFPVENFHIKV